MARAFRWDRSDPLSLPAFVLLLVTVAVAPFPWGRVVSGDTLVLELLSFGTAALAILTRGYRVPVGRAWVPMAALSAVALLGFLQAAPLPEGLVSRLAPESARTWREANAVLAAHGRPPEPFRVSLAPAETRATALLGLSYVALFFAASRVAASRHRRRVFVAVLLGTAFAAIATAVTRGEGLERIRDPFVNPNHLAGYLQAALAVAFGLQWSQLRQADRGTEGWLARLEAITRSILPIGATVLLWGAVGAGLALTRSRGGILGAIAATLVLMGLAIAHRRQSRAAAKGGRAAHAGTAVGLVLAVALSAAFAASTTGKGPFLRFLAADPNDIGSDGRVVVWRHSLEAWRLHPVLGSGLGTFREAFRQVQPRGFTGLVDQAHSESLQLLVTSGLVGFLLGGFALLAGVQLLVRRFLAQRHHEEGAVALAGLGALVALLVHGLVEFNFSIPAIPATLAALLGAAWAASGWSPRTPVLVASQPSEVRASGPASVEIEKDRRPESPESGTASVASPLTRVVPIRPPSQP